MIHFVSYTDMKCSLFLLVLVAAVAVNAGEFVFKLIKKQNPDEVNEVY